MDVGPKFQFTISMAGVDQLISHLKSNNVMISKQQKAFIHLLRFVQCSSLSQLTTDLLEGLIHIYLQSVPTAPERIKMSKVITAELETFAKKYPVDVDIIFLQKLLSQQVIKLENSVELITIISRHLKKTTKNKKIKLKILEDQKVMALILDEQGCLEVQVYSNNVKIINGSLTPLRPMTCLTYDEYKEFQLDQLQTLWAQDYFYSFKVKDRAIKGKKLSPRDHSIKQSLAGALNSESEIFFLLKSIEKHYIDLSSDPFYQELCQKIDLAINSLKDKQPQAILFAKKSIKLAYLALKYMFDDDNYLRYKLLELERTIKSEVQWVKESQINQIS